MVGAVGIMYAQGKIDTLYYNSDCKYAPNKNFASFYRVAYYPTDTLVMKQYIDYYTTGEIRGSGNFIKLDATDDAKSIFDGKCIVYFKNGKQSVVSNYKNGVLDGDIFVYQENGLIKTKGAFCNGQQSGIWTEFYDDNTFFQAEYTNGNPTFDYYIKGDANGNLTKFRISDNTPIWETPAISERSLEYKDGTQWQIFNKNGMMIALTDTTVNDYGKWHRIDIVISNNTIIPIEFNPVENITANSKDSQGYISNLRVWSSDDYLRKVRRAQIFAAVMMGLSEGLATANAGYSTSTSNAYHYGNAYAYGSGGYAYGNYSGITTSKTVSYDANAAYQARVVSQQRMADFSNALAKEQEIKKLGYLKTNTIYPGETISGYVHVQRIKGESVQFIINIQGAEYIFDWTFGKKKTKANRARSKKSCY